MPRVHRLQAAAGCAGTGEAPAVVVATSPTLSQAPQPLWQLDGVQWFVVLPQKPAELQTDKGQRGGGMQPVEKLPPKSTCSYCKRRQLRATRANMLGQLIFAMIQKPIIMKSPC